MAHFNLRGQVNVGSNSLSEIRVDWGTIQSGFTYLGISFGRSHKQQQWLKIWARRSRVCSHALWLRCHCVLKADLSVCLLKSQHRRDGCGSVYVCVSNCKSHVSSDCITLFSLKWSKFKGHQGKQCLHGNTSGAVGGAGHLQITRAKMVLLTFCGPHAPGRTLSYLLLYYICDLLELQACLYATCCVLFQLHSSGRNRIHRPKAYAQYTWAQGYLLSALCSVAPFMHRGEHLWYHPQGGSSTQKK